MRDRWWARRFAPLPIATAPRNNEATALAASALRTLTSSQGRPLKSCPGRNHHAAFDQFPRLRARHSQRVPADRHGLCRRGAGDDLGRADGGLQGAGSRIRARHRPQGADRLRAVDGHDDQRHSGAARSGRACRRPDHGRLCARRSRQERQGDRRQQDRSRQIADRGRRKIGHAQAGHLHARCAQARAAGGEDHRLFRQRQRRLCLDRDVRQARHCRRNEGQGAEDSGHARRRDRRARRRRDRLPADERIEAGGRHRHRRPAAGRVAEDHDILRRDRQRLERTGCRQGADQVPRLARRARRNRQERHGPDCGGATN